MNGSKPARKPSGLRFKVAVSFELLNNGKVFKFGTVVIPRSGSIIDHVFKEISNWVGVDDKTGLKILNMYDH